MFLHSSDQPDVPTIQTATALHRRLSRLLRREAELDSGLGEVLRQLTRVLDIRELGFSRGRDLALLRYGISDTDTRELVALADDALTDDARPDDAPAGEQFSDALVPECSTTARADRIARELVRRRQRVRWGRASLLKKMDRGRAHRPLGHERFDDYLRAEFHLAPRRSQECTRLLERMAGLPLVEEAWRDGRVTELQAALITRIVLPETQAAWLHEAERCSTKRLELDVTGQEELRDTLGEEEWLSLEGGRPRSMTPMRELRPGVSLTTGTTEAGKTTAGHQSRVRIRLRMSAFIMDGSDIADRNGEATRGIRERDRWRCVIPTCRSRGPLRVQDVVFRSNAHHIHGHADHEWNLATVCAACDERLVQSGAVRLVGRAPDGLVLLVGLRPDGTVTEAWRDGRRLDASHWLWKEGTGRESAGVETA